ncbi:DddA-like double-stranded DNA deaminase toxin [Streptoalloteichus hindustanus]|uniref:DddA-like double-stranded DNA deaminase toxin n=1 Tax=Streptoalloteichus hindustanus TaxID=2017 RepID=UPI00135668DB|nr:DddA-like double-stranded DNA deaminase toxin [Streptoalloteichus hindustanus]
MSAVEEAAAGVRAAAERLPAQEITVASDALRDCHEAVVTATEGSGAEEPAQAAAWLASAAERLTEVAQLVAELRTRLHRFADHLANPSPPARTSTPVPPTRQTRSPVDRQWGQRARARLPVRPNGRGPTLGTYVDQDGIEHSVRSGAEEDGLDQELAYFMWSEGLVRPDMTRPDGSRHVELKVAYRMRVSNTPHAELAINNEIDKELYGCHRLLPRVLAPGQVLVVHDDLGTHVYRGKGGRQR